MKKIVISISIILLVCIIVIFITNIDTTKAATTTLSQTVINLSQGNSWSAGASGVYQTNSHEYRYVGAEPNNYVNFNDDLYQIIGVFDSNSTGVSGNLVKLIRSRPIGSYSWGVTNSATSYLDYSTYNSDWETADANILLNEFFLNATNRSSSYNLCTYWTYFYSHNYYRTYDCSKIIGYGIQTATLRNYIQPVTWYLKGYNGAGYSKQNFYTCERSDTSTITNCNSGNSGSAAKKVTSKSIGLMYISDYLYASGYYSSSDTTVGSDMLYGQQNWLYNGKEWTITPVSDDDSYSFYVRGGVSLSYANYAYAIRPTFYLKSSVYVTGGNGSFHNPYTIACDTCNS